MLDDARHQLDHVFDDGVHLDGLGAGGLVGGDGGRVGGPDDVAKPLAVQTDIVREDERVCVLVVDEGAS